MSDKYVMESYHIYHVVITISIDFYENWNNTGEHDETQKKITE